jgi:hypothetical protein
MYRFEKGEFRFIKTSEAVPVEPNALRALLFLLHSPQKLCILTNLFLPGLVKR